ncbi:MAG TPA: NADP-dependent oxidoreductase [Blastocatellia bacterium]|nr:NADP-dependent oxidoreductase [Blastocatellia bacterium]
MAHRVNRQWRLAARPAGMIKESDFKWTEEPVPVPGDGEFLIHNLYLSLDPTNRVWITDVESYLPPVGIGEVMRGGTVGVVEESNHPGFSVGDHVSGLLGWQDYAVSSGAGLSKLPNNPAIPLTAYMGLFSHIGLTAYYGLLDVGRPKAGETLVVSAAAGATGSIVGQIGKIKGCRVVGIAGSDDKCKWLTDDLGFDAAINYKTEDVNEALGRHCPNGIDVDFENVGGNILEAVLNHLNLRARVVLCGMISQYNATEPQPGPRNLGLLISKRARMEGFIVLDYMNRADEAFSEMGKWLMEGKLKYRVDEVEGLEKAPTALNKLFEGANQGKLVVKL